MEVIGQPGTQAVLPRVKSPRYPQSQFGRSGENKNVSPQPGFESQIDPARSPLITPTALFNVFAIGWCKLQR
jgi:hypothetical protein